MLYFLDFPIIDTLNIFSLNFSNLTKTHTFYINGIYDSYSIYMILIDSNTFTETVHDCDQK